MERNSFKLRVKDVFVLQDVRLYQKIQTMQRVRGRKIDAYEKDGRVKTDKSTAMKKQTPVQCPSKQAKSKTFDSRAGKHCQSKTQL